MEDQKPNSSATKTKAGSSSQLSVVCRI